MSGEDIGPLGTFQKGISSGQEDTIMLQIARPAGRELPELLSLTGSPELHGC